MDPTVKTLAAIAKHPVAVARFLDNWPDPNTERFKAMWDEEIETWIVNTHNRVRDEVARLEGRIDDLDQRIEERADDRESQRVYANYARQAYAEPIDERRRMLEFAAAALVNPILTAAQHSRAERVIRELDPEDVLWLSVIGRAAGRFYGDINCGEQRIVARRVWDDAPGRDVLVASGCVRLERIDTIGGMHVATVTREGRLVLRALRAYVVARPPPITIPGHEIYPGSRSEEEAWKMLAGLPGLRDQALRLGATCAATYGFLHRHYQTGAPVDPTAKAVLTFRGAPSETAQSMVALTAGWPIGPNVGTPVKTISVAAPPSSGETTEVAIHGPHDVVRWLADEVDAEWQ